MVTHLPQLKKFVLATPPPSPHLFHYKLLPKTKHGSVLNTH